ncbi:TrkA family potassium uptake protein [Streptomyces sp. UNOC14_S4]|uniref:potassium channel family protein n=1 Tax=Streptomyces sp. UNOC14_S4 TaxID=2872340 RepID=UPI001E3BEBE6|nr:potassium channel family protein [Streptomyces sp. UNOC14_S4]MCC3772817.1 potassium channel family protein [Streptomyces sp. UNOC14_S4]
MATKSERPDTRRTPTRKSLVRSLFRRRTRGEAEDDAEAGRSIVMPVQNAAAPLRQVLRRLVMALMVLAATTLLVYMDREGYHDNADGRVGFLDAAYYATVTLSTTGYGDITPVSDGARLTNIFVITPLRVLFLIILVGTTLEVLTERTRQQVRVHRWRSRMREHTVVVGYGTKGRHAIETLIGQGKPKEKIVVVDPQKKVVDAASADGLVGVLGDATRSETLQRAELPRASQVVICTERDDTAALVTLTARQLNKQATIVVAVREDENVPLLRQSGANTVVTSSSSAGRLLGMSMVSPNVGSVLEDLLTYGNGLDVVERPVTRPEAGGSPRDCEDLVVAVVRGHRLLHYTDPEAATLHLADRVITIRQTTPLEPS